MVGNNESKLSDFGVGDEEDYERISEAAWGVANAFVGSPLHTGHELVACPECGKTIEITVHEDDTYEGGHYFGEFTVPDEDSDGEYEKTDEWEGHDVVEWTGEEDSFEYWECDDCFSSREDC